MFREVVLEQLVELKGNVWYVIIFFICLRLQINFVVRCVYMNVIVKVDVFMFFEVIEIFINFFESVKVCFGFMFFFIFQFYLVNIFW